MKRYEGMFLFDSSVVRDWAAVEGEVQRLFERIGAEKLVCLKYDERKLAYEINKRKRGLYVLTYFNADPEKIRDLERDVQLSELTLRVLVLRAENLTDEKLAELQAHPVETPLSPQSGDGRGRHDDRGERGERRFDRRDDRREKSDDRRETDAKPEKAERGAGDESAAPSVADAQAEVAGKPVEG